MNALPDDALPALRRFARGLLYDRDRAEDVVQQAWLAALQKQPPAHALGGWLRVAARNLAHGIGREEARRSARERVAARAEALPSAAETAAQLELLHRLLDALEVLEEPARTSVRLRYLEGLPPREIARRLGLAPERVRDHLHRGLARLRRTLDAEGRREEFLTALVPLAGPQPWSLAGGPPLALPLGALLVKNQLLGALVLAVLLGGLWMARRGAAAPEQGADEHATLTLRAAQPAASERDESVPAPSSPAGARKALGTATSPVAATWIVRGHAFRGGEDFAGLALRGRVLAGIALVGIDVGIDAAGEVLAEGRFTTDANGDFAWALAPFGRTVTVWVTSASAEAPSDGSLALARVGEPAPEDLVLFAEPLDAWLAGTVLGPEGLPVAGARVEVRHEQTETDAAGRFELRVSSAAARPTVRARAAGFGSERTSLARFAALERRELELCLAPELVVQGVVLDEDGKPVAGAEVRASGAGEPVTTSDAEGRFALGGWSRTQDWIGVNASKDGYARGEASAQREGRDELELEVRLERGRRLAGRVLDEQGLALEGVSVGAAEANSSAYESVWTDAEGRFELGCVPRSRARLIAQRSGFAPTLHALDPAGIEQTELELVLTRGEVLAGIVLDPADRPVPWALVSYAFDWLLHGELVFTGPDGRFRLTGLPERPVEVECSRPGFASPRARSYRPGEENLVLRLEPLGAFAGRVLDASGTPVSSFVVRVAPAASTGGNADLVNIPAPLRFENPDGRFRFGGDIPAGKLATLEVTAEGYAPARRENARSAPAPDPDALVFELAPETLVRGRVFARASGEPLAGVRVSCAQDLAHGGPASAGSAAAVSDQRGRFELRGAPTGTTWLLAEAAGFPAALDGPFELGARTVERTLELARGARLAGRLLDAAGGGLAGEELDLAALEVPGAQRSWRVTSGADGAFLFEGLPAGLYHLRWARRAGEVEAFDLLQLVRLAQDETKTVELRPRGQASVRGVIAFDGELPRFASILLFDHRSFPESDESPQWARGGRGTIATDGRFELGPLEPGTYSAQTHFQLPGGGFAMGGSGLFEVPTEGVVDIVLRAEQRR